MTLRLILVRHAKSSWDDPLADDAARPLNGRGRKAAPAIGAWLSEQEIEPAEVVSSPAQRTLETWDRMAPSFSDSAVLRRAPHLYHASADQMLDVLRGCAASPVLMLGHNPGIGEFADRLLTVAPDHTRFFDYPTCATLIADFDIQDWSQVGFGTGRAAAFVIPADLR